MLEESNVNYYARRFPKVFNYAKGDIVFDQNGDEYLDFFSGAGTLNYGHNNPKLKEAAISFLNEDRILHCLDMDSVIKKEFIEKFDLLLAKRNLPYKLQFPGPTGTNAVEAAIKLARKVTKRRHIVSFTNSFHGMTATSYALSASKAESLQHAISQDILFFPYCDFENGIVDSMAFLEKMILTPGTGYQLPAAVILETIQAEGGVKIASVEWLKQLRAFTEKNNIILIVDDIQVGCGRTGHFFSFERAGIVPDIVLLSKSISGLGLPLSLLLLKPELDIWNPGEYNGTFRANNLALCTAKKALDYWMDDKLENEVKAKSQIIHNYLQTVEEMPDVVNIRGIGLIWGIEFIDGDTADRISKELFEQKLIIETCGNDGQVLKLLSPLTISEENLVKGLQQIIDVIKADSSYNTVLKDEVISSL
ncbi:diaminobutyrate-2-oxoglutarate transaminase [Pedobacter cryoconitis]|uniref:Diaminobutyrate-2-oxoglutarate transaminase n=1 Tax=Pedobacter cryoconitis TaxID=188932 RepID=A0A7W8ZJB2_9SPHI|nr:diaminobutyrate--2-oxoglutarate transaminase [Pedobacter cryoconitis]MBB5635101.1 diaminobutyrate-2-oxoglutarate transaminase [Pedobacter cryoconitis]MBB6271715.1 diaminobutyrate-2-oxoglutarate transaminase [Pedobacter cryoconitis]